jgi:hypothetical protein
MRWENQPGDLVSLTHYVRVREVLRAGMFGREKGLRVCDLDGGPEHFDILGTDLVERLASADGYAEVRKVTKTEAAEVLVGAVNIPFTVVFTKADGDERTLRGRLVRPEPLMGRSHVEDLDLPVTDKGRVRLVDHRTIQSLIVGGVKYEVK